MVGSVFFHISEGDDRSFMACITVMLAGMVLFLFQTIAVIIGARGKKWRQILEQAHADEVRGGLFYPAVFVSGAFQRRKAHVPF